MYRVVQKLIQEYVDFVTGEFRCQIRLLIWSSDIGQYVPLWSGEGMGDISILASQEKHFIKIYENLSQYPRILHQFVKSGTKGLGGNIICEYVN